MIFPIKRLADLGFEILATEGTAAVLRRNGVSAVVVRKHSEGPGPDGEPTIVGRILAGEVDLVINTPHGTTAGGSPRVDGYEIRTASVATSIPCITTVQGLAATVQGIEALLAGSLQVRSLQELVPPRPYRRPAAADAGYRGRGRGMSDQELGTLRGPLQVEGEVLLHQAGRRLRPRDVRGGGDRRTYPTRGTSSRCRSAARRRRRCCDARSPSIGRSRRESTAPPSRSSSLPTGRGLSGWPSVVRTTRSTSSGPSGGRSRCRASLSPVPWWAAGTAPRRCSRWPNACASATAAVHMVLGASTESRLFGVLEAKRSAQSVTVTTVDGSVGIAGLVTDPLPALLTQHSVGVVYSCGPMAMLAAVTRAATAHGAWSQTAVEESMACGIGVCMTCVLPVIGDDGVTRMLRSCVDGPVFAGQQVRWDDVGSIPMGTLGAPSTAGCDRRDGGVDDRRCATGRGRPHDGPRRRAAGQPGHDGERMRGRRTGAAPVLRRGRARCGGDQVDHARPQGRTRDAPDGRDAVGNAQLHRPAGTRHRRVPRAGPALAASARRAADRVHRRVVVGRVRRARPPGRQRARSGCGRGRTSPARTWRTAAWSSPATPCRRPG